MNEEEKKYIIRELKRHLKWLRGYTHNEFEIEATIKAIQAIEEA